MEKKSGAGAGAGAAREKNHEPEPLKNLPAPQPCRKHTKKIPRVLKQNFVLVGRFRGLILDDPLVETGRLKHI